MKTTLLTLLLALLFAVSISAQSVVMAPVMDVSPRTTVTIPIEIDEVEGLFVFEFHMAFDGNVMNPHGSNFGCSPADLTQDFNVTCNVVDGVLRVSAYGAHEVSGSGPILNVQFETTKTGCSDLRLSSLTAWVIPLAELKTASEDGLVCIVENP